MNRFIETKTIKPPNVFQDRTKNAQFIVISLRNNMYELCNRLVGIYKTHNCTKSVTLDPDKMAELVVAAQLGCKPVQQPKKSAATNKDGKLDEENGASEKEGADCLQTPVKRLRITQPVA